MAKQINLDTNPAAVEYVTFLMLSGELGKNFLKIPKRKRTDEQYARLFAITLVYDLKQVFWTLVKEADKRTEPVMDFLKSRDYATVQNWIEEAIENVRLAEIKAQCRKHWENKLKHADKTNFDIRKLF